MTNSLTYRLNWDAMEKNQNYSVDERAKWHQCVSHYNQSEHDVIDGTIVILHPKIY